MAAPLPCVIPVGDLCLPAYFATAERYDGVVKVVGKKPLRPADLGASMGLTVTSWSDDSFVTIPAASLSQACSDGRCVVFRARCSNDSTACAYQIADAPEAPANEVTLHTYVVKARTADLRQWAERNIYFHSPIRVGYVSLSQLLPGAPAPAARYSAPVFPQGSPND